VIRTKFYYYLLLFDFYISTIKFGIILSVLLYKVLLNKILLNKILLNKILLYIWVKKHLLLFLYKYL